MLNQTMPTPRKAGPILWAVGVTILLVILSDFLLFDGDIGINLFLIAIAIALGIVFLAVRRKRYRQGVVGFLAVAFLSLPLVEAPTLPGLALATLGLGISALVSVRLLPDRLENIPRTLFRFLLPAPATLIRDAAALRPALHEGTRRKAAIWVIGWAVPLSLGSVFVYLLASANPLIEAALSGLQLEPIANLLDPVRIIFWLVLAVGIWPCLRPRLLGRRRRSMRVSQSQAQHTTWLGRASIFRSLVAFNALFLVQTLLDLTYLWGGVVLPEGMSHAEYAHRGAYPLIATALLAGAFVLVAMRGGPGRHDKTIQWLVYFFIAQNVLLCLSAMLRLQLYVEAYSLTELRLAAAFWMALVATGLVLILLRIVLRKSNDWLIASNLLALTIVLYASAALDLSGYIARFNVEHSRELTGASLPADLGYLSALGPSAIPALDRLIPQLDPDTSRWTQATAIRAALVRDIANKPDNWRGWFWRQQRLRNSLAIDALASTPPNRQNGVEIAREMS